MKTIAWQVNGNIQAYVSCYMTYFELIGQSERELYLSYFVNLWDNFGAVWYVTVRWLTWCLA